MINLNPLISDEEGEGRKWAGDSPNRVCSVYRGGTEPIPVPLGLVRMQGLGSSVWGMIGWWGIPWGSPFRGNPDQKI